MQSFSRTLFIAILLSVLIWPCVNSFALAVATPPSPAFVNPLGADATLKTVVERVIIFLLELAALAAFLALITGAFLLIFSFGDQQKLQRAKHIIFWALAGLLLIGASVVVVQLIGRALQVVT